MDPIKISKPLIKQVATEQFFDFSSLSINKKDGKLGATIYFEIRNEEGNVVKFIEDRIEPEQFNEWFNALLESKGKSLFEKALIQEQLVDDVPEGALKNTFVNKEEKSEEPVAVAEEVTPAVEDPKVQP